MLILRILLVIILVGLQQIYQDPQNRKPTRSCNPKQRNDSRGGKLTSEDDVDGGVNETLKIPYIKQMKSGEVTLFVIPRILSIASLLRNH
jgi:hypothetical protein